MKANGSGRAKRDRHAFAKGDWLTFNRVDYIGTRVIFGIAVLGSVVFGVGAPVFAATTNAPLPVSYTTKVTSGIEPPSGTTHDGQATMDLLLTDATLGERFTQALPGLVMAALTVAVAWMLFQLLRSTQAREPFTRRNVSRINTIALVIGIGGTLVQLAQGVADNAINATGRLPDPRDLTFVITFTPLPLVVMLVIALIGEAFRRGVELRDDVEGLV